MKYETELKIADYIFIVIAIITIPIWIWIVIYQERRDKHFNDNRDYGEPE